MSLSSAAFGASARWLRRSPRARRSLVGVAIGVPVLLVWHWWPRAELPDFSSYGTPAERKAAFFNYLLPHVRAVNADVLEDRRRLLRIRDKLAGSGSAGFFDERWLNNLAEAYEVEPPDKLTAAFADQLLRRVDAVAPSLVLAQAATESAWGTSRFARHGSNLFGMRTYDGDGMVPHRRAEGKRFTVATYDSVRDSIAAYVSNLNTNPRYRYLRQIRADLRRQGRTVSGYALADGLRSYSTRGSEYIDLIQSIISSNDLGRFDEP